MGWVSCRQRAVRGRGRSAGEVARGAGGGRPPMGPCGVPWAPLTTAPSPAGVTLSGSRAGRACWPCVPVLVATRRARPSPTPSGRRGHRPGFRRLGGPLPVGGPAALRALGGSCLLFAWERWAARARRGLACPSGRASFGPSPMGAWLCFHPRLHGTPACRWGLSPLHRLGPLLGLSQVGAGLTGLGYVASSLAPGRCSRGLCPVP